MKKKNKKTRIPPGEFDKLYPEVSKILLSGSGREFVERIGIEAIRKAVLSVMIGENLRSQTEHISRRRIAQISGALIAMFTRGYLSIPGFQEKLSSLAIEQIYSTSGNLNENVWPAQWVLGLTGKSVQNVLRGDTEEFHSYVFEFENAIREAAEHCRSQLGNYSITLGYVGNEIEERFKLDWEGITRLTTAIGAQTLTIRGSDKSMYGKLFERLILGSILTIFGFIRVDKTTNKEIKNVFWLSDSSDERESDATAIISPGRIAKFDIGFIGPGNSEISKDKLSRFGAQLQSGGELKSSVTFIIVDRLPKTDKTIQAALNIGAEIVQMSMQIWPKELSIKMKERFDFKHEIQEIPDDQLESYLNTKLSEINLLEFIKNLPTQISDDPIDFMIGEEF